MGYARLGIYLAGLLVVVLAGWVFLTQTEFGRTIPSGVGLVLILLLVGIGIMAAASTIRDARVTRRVVHDGDAFGRRTVVDDDVDAVDRGTVVDERRWE